VDHFRRVKWTVVGTMEKDLLQDPATEDKYVAKLGGRNSDLEVATEYAIFLIGRTLGAHSADARLARYQGRLRFLSRYFLNDDEELAHGVELFRELYEDVDAVLKDAEREQRLFAVQAVQAVFGAHFLDQADAIFRDFVAMLVHDAIIGLMDRHPENWGVIVSRGRDHIPRFAPLFDSARGLFCDETDEHFRKHYFGPMGQKALDRYVAGGRPLVGWQGASLGGRKYIRYPELISRIYWMYPKMRSMIDDILGRFDHRAVRAALDQGVDDLLSPARRAFILTTLRRRIRGIRRALNSPDKAADVR
jgi:hypothetical protein